MSERASPRVEQLLDLLGELDENREAARSVVGRVSGSELRRRPDPDAWSVAECLDHLVRTGEAYFPAIDRALGRARDEGLRSEGPFSRGFLGRWLVRGMEPPPGFGVPAPKAFRPELPEDVSAEAEDPLARFLEHQEGLARRIREADGLDLEAVKVPAPVASFLRINLYACLAYLSAHQRRHLWQARQVAERLEEAGEAGPRVHHPGTTGTEDP